ncbi:MULTISPECIES: hypothetical protein [unclassified Pseudomonas]|uniref:hypothetical protein n=1 Tax=unclassified Pseudomonas TaxID=196821 RepID=UPI00244A3308|nr:MULTISPECIES: hypothetical protein [unclassified Pseudomonas]MDG9925092.1 hypothetical protein [Pseudomonas sp. GD04045]MDH0037033.1 hypothetical protein [Pseudomonas sp. GD04019]
MLRIKGRVGDWPVDLTVEMDAEDWAQLAAHLPMEAPPAAPRTASAGNPADGLWPLAQELLQRAGSMEGPQLLGELSALAGGDAAGKRLLVRLRHCPQVQIESGAEAPLYRWIG